jgi:hypothetical protein
MGAKEGVMPTSELPFGEHDYRDIIKQWREGKYNFACVRNRTGVRPLIGVTEHQYASILESVRSRQIDCLLSGSRIAGPRSEQRQMHPALAHTPLETGGRRPSATYPEVRNIKITKTSIKEYGLNDPRTSDLSLLLINSQQRSKLELMECAECLERELKHVGLNFPIRVYWILDSCIFESEDDYLNFCLETFLYRELPPCHPYTDEVLKEALKLTYILIRTTGG